MANIFNDEPHNFKVSVNQNGTAFTIVDEDSHLGMSISGALDDPVSLSKALTSYLIDVSEMKNKKKFKKFNKTAEEQ